MELESIMNIKLTPRFSFSRQQQKFRDAPRCLINMRTLKTKGKRKGTVESSIIPQKLGTVSERLIEFVLDEPMERAIDGELKSELRRLYNEYYGLVKKHDLCKGPHRLELSKEL